MIKTIPCVKIPCGLAAGFFITFLVFKRLRIKIGLFLLMCAAPHKSSKTYQRDYHSVHNSPASPRALKIKTVEEFIRY